MKKNEIVKYWVDSSEVDFKAMESLFTSGHYVWALFIAHLVIEKLLKAYYVKSIDTESPRTHNLQQIAKKASLYLTEKQNDFLEEITTFNLNARYPDFKQRFYKKATLEFAEYYLDKTKEFRQWMVKKIKS